MAKEKKSSGKKVHFTIVKRNDGWIVVPGIGLASVGDTAVWKPIGAKLLEIDLPDTFSPQQLNSNGTEVEAQIVSGLGYYDYTILATDTQKKGKLKKAKGASSPGIIID